MYRRTGFFIMVIFLSQLMVFTVSASVTVKASKYLAESGKIIPATFTFSPKLKSGEVAVILIDNVVAMKFFVSKGEVEEFYSRFRMSRSGTITAKRMVYGSVVEEGKAYQKIRKGSTASGSPSLLDHSRIQEKIYNGVYASKIQTENGFNNILVLKDDDFEVEIQGSSKISNKSTIYVRGSFSQNLESSFKEKMSNTENASRKDVSRKDVSRKNLIPEVPFKMFGITLGKAPEFEVSLKMSRLSPSYFSYKPKEKSIYFLKHYIYLDSNADKVIRAEGVSERFYLRNKDKCELKFNHYMAKKMKEGFSLKEAITDATGASIRKYENPNGYILSAVNSCSKNKRDFYYYKITGKLR